MGTFIFNNVSLTALLLILTVGVATYVKDSAMPDKAVEGLTDIFCTKADDQCIDGLGEPVRYVDGDLQSLDNEGRTVITQHTVR